MLSLLVAVLAFFSLTMANSPPRGKVTEITSVYLKPGTDVTVGEAKKIWNDAIKTIDAQNGAEKMWYGVTAENKDNIQVVIQWSSLQAQEAFTTSPSFPGFIASLEKISRQPDFFTRSLFPTSTLPALSAPVTEFAYQWVAYDKAPGYRERVRKPFEAALAKAKEMYGFASAQAVDDVESAYFKDVGGKGKLWIAVVGWQTVAAHWKWAEGKDFKEVYPLLLNNTKGLELVHAPLKKVIG